MNECLNNWMSDVGFENAIVSIEAFHIMFGNNRDPDMNYNPFMPCTSVPITIRGFTTFVGAGYWSFRGAIGGVNLGKGITAIPSWVEGDDDISNVIAHEIAHTTNDIVNSKPIMYRVEFGNGDHL